ncbi:hypothetical protein AB204_13040 [Xenorhabdus khoisanae]|uniref:Uncharacterized protein n=1 Tax=Xenorhabdus khoisanae TaxID=880157 RepID=A0A0J5IN98_9GAMM|nr:hypothetical protein [Xenorhabdus khoisanae]KMJ44695.1 hypothetical protein AB204_13040 [Xenorhabdus khoisanae]
MNTEFNSLADGGELSRETWDDFVKRLEYQHKGAGIDRHFTAYPSFTVRERVRVVGYEDDEIGIYSDGEEYYSLEAALDSCEDTQKEKIFEHAQEEYLSYWSELDDHDKAICIISILEDSYIFYWKYDYRTVNTHLTREAAEIFIKRKQHDHGQLSVYVESFYWCWEMRALIDGILTGKIKYTGDSND